MAYVNRVADLAEEVNHHRDILVHGWNRVRLTLTTHSAGRLTDNDYEMARKMYQLPVRGCPTGHRSTRNDPWGGPPWFSAATMPSSPDERRRQLPK
jgi:hypothetical protein